MKVAIFKANQLGDNVVFLPVVQTLRRLAPDWQLLLFTSPVAAPLFTGDLPTEAIRTVPTKDFLGAWKHPLKLARLWKQVRDFHPDACLLAEDQGNVAHLLSLLSGARLRVGAHSPFLRFNPRLDVEIPHFNGEMAAKIAWETGRALADSLGLSGWPQRSVPPNLDHLTLDAQPIAQRLVIHPGGSLAYKRWDVERFAEVAAQWLGQGEVVWIAPQEVPTPTLPKEVQVVRPNSIATLVQTLASSHVFLGNNSGPMNLIFALGRPAVILNGPSTSSWDPYWFPERVRMLRNPAVACIPCDTSRQPAMECRRDDDPMICLRSWSSQTVSAIVKEWAAQWPVQDSREVTP